MEDQKINRTILRYMIQNDYDVLEAENGAQAWSILEENSEEIIAILLDIVMPVMDGYEFLKRLKDSPWEGIPVIAMTGDSDISTEERTLELGAWDFIIKPYKERILMTRLKNAIARSRMGYLQQMKHMAEHDSVTGLYNRMHFFKKTEEMLKKYPTEPFVFIRMDIKRFRLINSYWGEEVGNRSCALWETFSVKYPGTIPTVPSAGSNPTFSASVSLMRKGIVRECCVF